MPMDGQSDRRDQLYTLVAGTYIRLVWAVSSTELLAEGSNRPIAVGLQDLFQSTSTAAAFNQLPLTGA